MATLMVEVPEKIALRFRSSNVVSYNDLITADADLDMEKWTRVPVWEKAETVLAYLKSINQN